RRAECSTSRPVSSPAAEPSRRPSARRRVRRTREILPAKTGCDNRPLMVPLLFFLSGTAALVLETVFLRQLTWLAGSAVTATSLVLAAFMGGLALGAAVFGTVADRTARPLALYGLLELGVAASATTLVLLLARGRH